MVDCSDEILKQVAQGIIEEYRQAGNPLTAEQEVEFDQFVAGLVDAEPPRADQIWQTIEIAIEAMRAKHKEKALQAVNFFMLQFISGCDQSSGAFQFVPMLNQAKEAIKTDRFDQAEQRLMTFLKKCRDAAQAM